MLKENIFWITEGSICFYCTCKHKLLRNVAVLFIYPSFAEQQVTALVWSFFMLLKERTVLF
jgi:hypothetical protein